MKKKKVLVVIQLIRRGGVELVAINFARQLNPDNFDVTFLLINPDEEQDGKFADDLLSDGFKIIEVPKSANSYYKKYKFIDDLMARENYDIVHSHVLFFSALVLKAAKKNGVKIRAAHSHAIKWNRKENIPYKTYKTIMRSILNKNANVKFACSKASGEFLYGKNQFEKNGIFIPNGIEIDTFAFSDEDRNKIRNEFNISDNTLLVGHIGTIYRIKNQVFLVEILSELIKKNYDAKLILVGEEVDKLPVIEKAEELGVTDNVIFAGQRSDANSFYQAMDIMIFPSLHEALPLSLIEAQASKLPCLISDTVTREVKFNDNIDFMSLEKTAFEWSEKALKLLQIRRQDVLINDLVDEYDIKKVVKELEKIYLS